MKRSFSALLLGVLLTSTGASYASAGWMDNVPARFLPGHARSGATQNLSRTSEPTDGVLVTGSVDRAPARSGYSPQSGWPGKP
jgi:hypothetical protein